MYRINDKASAIKSIQKYIQKIGTPDFFVAPTGIYDEKTRLSVKDFQRQNGLAVDGIVDLKTFNSLYLKYSNFIERDKLIKQTASFFSFPLRPGDFNDEMTHVNRILSELLEIYGQTHDLTNSNFYSPNTSYAVKQIRHIYLLDNKDEIDEELYGRMINDHNSIFESMDFFN